jgi:hypothetical protein
MGFWRHAMSRFQIFALYVVFDLLIIAGVVWCVFHRWPVRQYFFPAMALFAVSGAWLIVMTIRSTAPRD